MSIRIDVTFSLGTSLGQDTDMLLRPKSLLPVCHSPDDNWAPTHLGDIKLSFYDLTWGHDTARPMV